MSETQPTGPGPEDPVQAGRRINQEAYKQLKPEIDTTYPRNHFIAIVGGQIVADASTFGEILEKTNPLETNPELCLVVQAGVNYPERTMLRGHGMLSARRPTSIEKPQPERPTQ